LVRSRIGFGCWGIGGGTKINPAYGKISETKAIELLEFSLKKKINFFDVSPAYGNSEKLLGFILKKNRREDLIISTKCGVSDFSQKSSFSKQSIISQIKNSLQVLGTEYIDFLQLHNPPKDFLSNMEYFTFIKNLFGKKIRNFGISLRNPEDFYCINDFSMVDFIQVNFNILDIRILEKNIYEKCKKMNIKIIARTPLAFGFLTGKYSAKHIFDEDDHRKFWKIDQRRKWIEESNKIFKKVVKDENVTRAQLCLNFCLSFSQIHIVLPGMINKSQIIENVKAEKIKNLSEDNIKRIKEYNIKYFKFDQYVG
tara:strand:+ start:1643 stop:2575 length:933 start_codon:yes stop_codon:yes gene_type:complete